MIDFKQLQQNDFQLLHEWFKEPTINSLYAEGKTWSIKSIENKYFPRILALDKVPSFIIYSNNKAIGFIQYYLPF